MQAFSQGINFQGVARSANGTIIANSNISLRLSIIAKNVDATPEYIETKTVITNTQGIFSIVVGDASNTTIAGSFKNISWSDAPKFLKVEMDPAGGTNYINMGATQLQYVPYSFYSLGVADLSTANDNVYLGNKAGANSLFSNSSNKLLIANSNTTTPLIYGDFTNKKLKFNADIDSLSILNRINFVDENANDHIAKYDTGYSSPLIYSRNFYGHYGDLVLQGMSKTYTGNIHFVTGSNMPGYESPRQRMVIMDNGNIGIGDFTSTPPTSKLQVSGIVSASGYKIPGGTSSQYLRADGTVSSNLSTGVPYTGATQAVDLGAYNLKVNGVSVGVGSINNLGVNTNTNTIIGNNAFVNNTSGTLTTAVGYYALNANTTGMWNDAFGSSALRSNTTGSYNSAFGSWSMLNNTSGSQNNSFGRNTLRYNTTGSNNSAFGRNAMISNTTGNDNTALGIYALTSNTTGNNNTAIGNSALYSNGANSASVAVGHNAMKYADDKRNNGIETGSTAVGYEALKGSEVSSNNTGINNTALGYKSITNITIGSNNTAIGYNTMINNSEFNNSTAIGANSEVTQSNQIKLGDDNVTNVTTSGLISSGKGFLAKGVSASERDAIESPIGGLIIYCRDCGTNGEIQFYNGVSWKNINGSNIASPTTNSISLGSSVGTDNQTVSVNTTIVTIRYTTALATGVLVANLPSGVTSSWSNNILTISGTPSVLGSFSYTITLTGGSGTVTKNGVIKVVNLNATLTSASGTTSQTICTGSTIAPITYSTAGVSTVTFYGLPNGIVGNFSNNVATISGSGYVSGKFIYTATFTDGTNNKVLKGVLNITPLNSFELSSGTNSQNIVLTNPITPIVYMTKGATGVSVSGLPNGVNYAWTNNTLTISGTPTSAGVTNFSLNSTGGCPSSSVSNNIILVHRNCAYTNMAGSYKVIRDEWEDWSVNDIVTVNQGPTANTIDFSNVYPNRQIANVVNPLIINIDPANGSASINEPIQFERYSSGTVVTAYSVSGNFYACDGIIKLSFDMGTYGSGIYAIFLQKL